MPLRKIGVLLANMGTPKSPSTTDVRQYLRTFLSDQRIIETPRFIWFFVLNFAILPFRPKESAKKYAEVWTDRGAPLLVITNDQAAALRQALPDNYHVVVGMRYSEPSIQHGLDTLIADGVDKIIVLPLYPQYCAATTAAVFDSVADTLKSRRYFPELQVLGAYHRHPAYIKACVHRIEESLRDVSVDELVLSYHGMPLSTHVKGDPYYAQCLETTSLITKALTSRPGLKITTVFQSKFGKAEWLKPYSFEYLPSLPAQGVKRVAVFCPGFSADCLETIEEMGDENREYFIEKGGEYYQLIPSLNTDALHVEMLRQIVTGCQQQS